MEKASTTASSSMMMIMIEKEGRYDAADAESGAIVTPTKAAVKLRSPPPPGAGIWSASFTPTDDDEPFAEVLAALYGGDNGGTSEKGGGDEDTTNNIGSERQRDAMPDDGSGMMGQQGDQMRLRLRRVTAVAYTTEHWTEEEHGGRLHLFLSPVQAKAWAEAGWPGRGSQGTADADPTKQRICACNVTFKVGHHPVGSSCNNQLVIILQYSAGCYPHHLSITMMEFNILCGTYLLGHWSICNNQLLGASILYSYYCGLLL